MPTSTGSSSASTVADAAQEPAGWWKLPAQVGIRAAVVGGPVRLADELVSRLAKVLTFVLHHLTGSDSAPAPVPPTPVRTAPAAVKPAAPSAAPRQTPTAVAPVRPPQPKPAAFPIAEYDSLSAARAITAIRALADPVALHEVARQERAGKARVTVINAIDQRVRGLAAPQSD